MTLSSDLRAARALLAKGWTQGTDARNSVGYTVPFNHITACVWCFTGALQAIGGGPWTNRFNEMCFAIRTVIGPGGIPAWNDTPGRTQAEVLSVLDRAIAAAEAQEK